MLRAGKPWLGAGRKPGRESSLKGFPKADHLEAPGLRFAIPGSGSRKAAPQAPTHEASICLRLDTALLKESAMPWPALLLANLCASGLEALASSKAQARKRELSQRISKGRPS